MKYPDTPVIVDHLCRIGADGTIRDGDVKILCDMARHKKVMVKVGAFYAFGKTGDQGLRRPALHVGE
jgi:hypothetical protein